MGGVFRLDQLLGPEKEPPTRSAAADRLSGLGGPSLPGLREPGPIRRGAAVGGQFIVKTIGGTMRAAGRALQNPTVDPLNKLIGISDETPQANIRLGAWLEGQGAQMAEAAGEKMAAIKGPEKRLTEIRTLAEAAEWAAFTVSQGVVSSLPSLVGGTVGAVIGGPGGAFVGAMGPGYLMNQEEVRSSLLEEGVSEETAQKLSGIVAVPMAMLDAVLPGKLGAELTAPVRKQMTKSVVRTFLAGTLKAGAIEAPTEFGQAGIERITTAAATGRRFTGQDLVQMIEEGVGGGLTGMFLGGAGQAVSAVRGAAQAPTEAVPPPTPVAEETVNLDDLLGKEPAEAQPAERATPRTMQEFDEELARNLRAVEKPPLINRRPEVSAADRERLNLPPEEAPVERPEEAVRPKDILNTPTLPADQEFAFHVTSEERLDDIISAGRLKPHRPSFGTDQTSWPDGSIQKRAYFTPDTPRSQFAPEDVSKSNRAITLRIRKEGLERESVVGDLFSTKSISIDKLEVLGEDGLWTPLRGGAVEQPLLEQAREPEVPEVASLAKAEGAAIRERLGLEELQPAARQSFQAAWDEALGRNLADQATDVAQEAAASKRPLTPTEHAGAVQRYLELEKDLTEVRSTLADAIRQGNDQVTQQLSIRSDRILDEIDALTEATDRSGSEAGRALSVRRLRANVETFTLASGLQMARSRKGGSLAAQEVNKIEELTGKISTLEEQNTKLRTENDELEQKRLKAIAEQVVRVEAKRKPGGVAARLQERQVVLQQLNELGLRLNDISGVSAEGLFLIGKLTVNTIRETVARTGEKVELGRIVDEVLAELNNPEIRPRDIHEALNARDPKRKQQQASDAAQQVRRLKTHARLITQVEDAEAGLFAPSRKRPIAPAEIRQLQKRLTDLRNSAYRAGLRPERLERAIATLNELQDQLTNHFRNIKRGQPVEVTPELEAIQAKIRGLRQEMRVEDLLADLNEQLRTGDFKVPKKRVTPHLSPQLERNQIALKRAQRKWRDAIERMAPLTLHRAIGETTGFLRTMKATADMSATMRQAFWLSARRPITATKVFARSVRAFFSEFTADQIDNAIRQHPNQLLRDRAKLTLTERGGKLSDREEMFTSNLAEQLPVFGAVVRASNQSMTTTLNLIRVAAFDQFLELYPNATTDELRAWASWVNIASGRGDLGRLAAVGNELSLVFFAPRFAVSRIQTPFVIFKFWRLPRVRKEIAKDYAAVVAVGLTALGLAAAAGLKVGRDPRDSDFGKIRIGNTRIDIWAGVQQPVRLLARIMLGLTDRIGLTGRHLTKSEKEVDPLELLGRFSAFKIAPSVSIPLELYRGKTAVGEETTPSETAVRSMLPIIFEDVFEASRDGFGRAALAGGSAFVGLGVSTFGDRKPVRGGPRAPRRPQPPRLPVRR